MNKLQSRQIFATATPSRTLLLLSPPPHGSAIRITTTTTRRSFNPAISSNYTSSSSASLFPPSGSSQLRSFTSNSSSCTTSYRTSVVSSLARRSRSTAALAPPRPPIATLLRTTWTARRYPRLQKQHEQATRRRNMSSAMRMAERLHGKTILITGASSGIGRSTALEFARTSPKELRLILTARREDALKELAAEIRKEVGDGVQVLPCKLDMSDAPAVESFVASLQGPWRHVHCLVNNAGMVKGDEKSPDIALADIQEMLNTNVTGLITTTQAVMKLYRENGPPGSNGQGDVINVGSIAGREGYPGGSIYCATKAAVRSFTEALRKEQIHSLVRVMEIDPGRVETNFSVVRFRGDKAKADAVYANTEPLTPDDIAEIIVFMAGRRENVVIADTMVYPQHQGSATHVHRKS